MWKWRTSANETEKCGIIARKEVIKGRASRAKNQLGVEDILDEGLTLNGPFNIVSMSCKLLDLLLKVST